MTDNISNNSHYEREDKELEIICTQNETSFTLEAVEKMIERFSNLQILLTENSQLNSEFLSICSKEVKKSDFPVLIGCNEKDFFNLQEKISSTSPLFGKGKLNLTEQLFITLFYLRHDISFKLDQSLFPATSLSMIKKQIKTIIKKLSQLYPKIVEKYPSFNEIVENFSPSGLQDDLPGCFGFADATY